MASKPYQIRIPNGLLELAELRSRQEHVDKSTALRQLLYLGAEDYLLNLYARGRVSLLQVAAMLEVPPQRVLELLEQQGLALREDPELLRASQATARTLEAVT